MYLFIYIFIYIKEKIQKYMKVVQVINSEENIIYDVTAISENIKARDLHFLNEIIRFFYIHIDAMCI